MAGTRTRRLRAGTYAERKDYPWRLSARLHRRVTLAAERCQITTTMYVLNLLETAIRHAPDAERLAQYEDPTAQEPRVTVTLRMMPALYVRLRKAATKAGVSMNRYVCFVVNGAT